MKRWFLFVLALVLALPLAGLCEETEEWRLAPTITKAYEISAGKLYLEWEGHAPVYQVYMDGKNVATVSISNAVFPITAGSHSILVYPINEEKKADTKLDFGLEILGIGGNIGLDLAALGIDPKNLTAGNPSAPLSIDFMSAPILKAVPEKLGAVTDSQDRVQLSFIDRYYADEYDVSVKIGKDVNHVRFARGSAEADALIAQNGTIVTLTLDPAYLSKQKCLIPELGSEYTFTVQLRSYAENQVNGEALTTAVQLSKESDRLAYTPTAAWKTAPVISYASQTADGEITLAWEHEDYGLNCTYAVMKLDKKLGIRTGETEMLVTREHSCVITDLMNGEYALAVVPRLEKESGSYSDEASVRIQNEWVAAPVLACEQSGERSVRLSWQAAEGVSSYHITAYRGDSDSLLRFVQLDFSKHEEMDVPAAAGDMEATFIYDGEIDQEMGVRLKFEIYGIRHAQDGTEQQTASSSQMMTLLPDGQTAQ